MREICWDTETTGLSASRGDRIVEIACVELLDLMPTGRTWHTYLNPERDMPEEARRVHGHTREFLSDKPKFASKAREFLDWIGDSPMVAHYASFDRGFIDEELRRAGFRPLSNPSVDTVPLARRMFPGGKVSLDDMCRKFGIDLSRRTRHGALIDTELLAAVYLELMGGRHRSLDFAARPGGPGAAAVAPLRPVRAARPMGGPSAAEIEAHGAFLSGVKDPVWRALLEAAAPTFRR